MKSVTAVAAILLASLVVKGSASAQDHAANANFPFAFYVENSWVPAGNVHHAFRLEPPEVVAIRNGNNTVSLLDLGQLPPAACR